MESKRILILTPWAPYPVTGACQQDRFTGLQHMKSMGYDLQVIAKIHHFQDRKDIKTAFEHEGIPLTLVNHPRHPWTLLFKKFFSIIRTPALIDGAALEYTDPIYERVVLDTVRNFKPDVIWMEYSTHWPVLRLLKKFAIPIIIKSSLNEAQNCMDEHGHSLVSRLKSPLKLLGERIAARESDFILAITPDEQKFYQHLGAKYTDVLPLRGLSKCFTVKQHEAKDVLNVVFLSSNYNMGHNRDALAFLLEKILPLVRQELPGQFCFHLTGKKFPERYEKFLADDVRATGFVENLGTFLATMDIALCPSISGAGMQQKVFEPLCRSLPLLTTKTAGYPFIDGTEVILCKTADDYLKGLRRLMDPQERNHIATAAHIKARKLFGEDAVKEIVRYAISSVNPK